MTNAALIPLNSIQNALNRVQTPQDGRKLEEVALAAQNIAGRLARLYKEETEYREQYIAYMRLYVEARRKTIELIQPYITHGGRSHDVTLSDFSMDKREYNRRIKELAVTQEQVDQYFDDCLAFGWASPSIAGMLKHSGHGGQETDAYDSDRRAAYNAMYKLIDKHRDRLTDHERKVAALVLDAFGERGTK